jgi:hypothetical protein
MNKGKDAKIRETVRTQENPVSIYFKVELRASVVHNSTHYHSSSTVNYNTFRLAAYPMCFHVCNAIFMAILQTIVILL